MKEKKTIIFRPTTSKSGVFLLELVLVILFFSIASTVCIEMFVKSYTISNDSTHLNKSIQITENIAESFKSSNTIIDDPYTETYYYSENLTKSSDADYTYIAIVDCYSNDNMNTALISVYAGDTNYFSLQVDKYISDGAEAIFSEKQEVANEE